MIPLTSFPSSGRPKTISNWPSSHFSDFPARRFTPTFPLVGDVALLARQTCFAQYSLGSHSTEADWNFWKIKVQQVLFSFFSSFTPIFFNLSAQMFELKIFFFADHLSTPPCN
jgi:hypothetical protein